MKKQMALAVVFVAFGACAAVETNYWQQVNGSLDGSWGDPEHWSLGHVPLELGELAVIDPLRTGGSSATFTIIVDDDYKAGDIIIGDPDNSTRNQGVMFTGAGSIVFAGKVISQTVFRACKGGITFDGPSFTLNCGGGLLNYSNVTVKNGSSLWVDKGYVSWKIYDNLRVENGGTVSVGSVGYGNSAHDHSITVNEGGVFECRGNFQDGANPANDYRFGLIVNGGSATVGQTLKLTREAAFVRMTSGFLKLGAMPVLALDDFSQFEITGGTLRLGFDVRTDAEQDAWYAYMTAHPDIVDGCNKLCSTNGATFRYDGTFYVSQLWNQDKSQSQQIDCDRLVFWGANWPFQWNQSASGTRITHLYGPTEIRVDGCNLGGYNNHYIYCHGKFVIDTRDWSDPSVSRTIAIRGLHSADGTLDLIVRGGGTFKFGQAYAYESCSSFTVEEGVNLVLGDRDATFGKSTEWGPLSTERLTLGKDVKVSFTAGEQHICASSWSIDPSVEISVTVNSTATHGAFPILVDLDSKDLPDSLLKQIKLVGANADGWQLENKFGQISVYRRDASEVGKYGDYEWIGGHSTSWVDQLNWGNGQHAMAENLAHVFGASDKTSLTFDNANATGGTTLGSVTFQTNAVQSFEIGGTKQATIGKTKVESNSWVPQVVRFGYRSTGNANANANYPGPLVFASGKTWTLKTPASNGYTIYGDVRVGCGATGSLGSLKLNTNNSNFPAFRTCLTVLSGGNLSFGRQDAVQDRANSSIRVSAGGMLEFPTAANCFYQWTSSPASIVVDGSLKIGVPFRNGANQSYRGSGRIDITGGTATVGNNATASFGGTLQVYPTTWSTVTPGNEGRALAMGANSGTPVIHVTDGWTYGPAAGVTPTASANSRAFVLANGAVATIEANGGSVRFVEGVRGFGTLAISNGTLTVEGACSGDQSVLAARAGATLKLVGDQTLGGLSAGPEAAVELDGEVTLGGELDLAGASLKISPTTVVSAAKGVKLGDTALDLGSETITSWRTLFTAGNGAIAGVPDAGNFYKFRTVETENGLELQCKSVTGFSIFVR